MVMDAIYALNSLYLVTRGLVGKNNNMNVYCVKFSI